MYIEEDMMLRNKHLRLDQEKIEKVQKILKAKTETETLERALDRVIRGEQERLRKKRIMKRLIELRNSLGKIDEDSAEWIRLARKEKTPSYDRGA
jgi:hypothetical protein